MIKYIYSILNTSNPNLSIFKFLVILAIVFIIYKVFKHYQILHVSKEGFTQDVPFIYKKDSEMYDEFYCQIYDKIHLPKHRIGHELINIVNITEPTAFSSVFLDVGSGTGATVNELSKAGYRAYGIDISEAMVKYSEELYPDNEYQWGDVTEPMTFDKFTFTHILCTYFTIYQFEDKRMFFYNCNSWLMPHGFLILHLVNPEKYDTIIPAVKSKLKVNPHKYEKDRITDSIIEFKEFQYKINYNFKKIKKKKLLVTETFTDNNTKNVRKNEQTLYMDSITDILSIAKNAGFIIHAKFNMKSCIDDKHQYIYILEKGN